MSSEALISEEEKSMSGFKASKDKVTLLLGATLSWRSFYHAENPRPLSNESTKSTLTMLSKWNNKS